MAGLASEQFSVARTTATASQHMQGGSPASALSAPQDVPIGGGVLAGAVGAWAHAGTMGVRQTPLGMLGLIFFAPVERVLVSPSTRVLGSHRL